MVERGLRASILLPVRRGPRAAELAYALALADRVLPGARLPPVEVRLTRSRVYSGGYAHTGRIELSRHAEHLGLAFLHELGHAVDHLLLGRGGQWGSETPALRGWWSAVRSSAAYGRLTSACVPGEAAYWPTRRETFARSFSQWAARGVGDRSLLDEVARRAAGAGRQWEADDFAPIARALDRALAPLAAAA
ncbi:MAG TPA: hypothetical protein VM184_05315 [Gaiellaceae bacterium]|nr:hypothetical protein [Gaiellaceae bacterium]